MRRTGPIKHRMSVLASILMMICLTISFASHTVTAAGPSGKYFDHIVTIVMENQDLASVLAHGHYQAALAKNYSLATGYSAVDHPSEPNYCIMLGATTSGCSDDGTCCSDAPNLIDRFQSSGLTWKAFAEDSDNSGTCNFSPPRGGDHFPFLLFNDVNSNSALCSNMLNTNSPRDSEFVSSLSDPSNAPNFVWLTPNDDDNSHDTSIGTGDHYLSGLVPRILTSPVFKNTRAALFIVYDEGNDNACHSGGQDCVYASWSGPVVANGLNSTTSYNHYSYTHTIEDNWGLQPLNQQDANAPVMSEFLTGAGLFGAGVTSQWLLLVIIAGVVASAAVIVWKVIPSKSTRVSHSTRRRASRGQTAAPPSTSP